jgi:glycosyltransferase involved in cell wall biosynthesis
MNLVIVIPCYNESKTIATVVRKSRWFDDKVIVIDNLSEDNTSEIAERFGAEVWKCPWKGAGITTAIGIKLAKTHYQADGVITIDGDGQHKPEDIPLLREKLVDGYDLVIGSRFLKKSSVPFYRKIGIGIINFAYNFGHEPISDSQCCMRGFSKNFMEKIDITEPGFGFSVETLVKARKLNLKITEVPVECIYHESFAQNSTLNPVKHGLAVLWSVIKWRLRLAD